ncbi:MULTISPECIES: peptidoglycan endopeptidase [unclassified Sphingomonas]|uniref:peptidoglycan endopeptidase n=1 Tax=unclassified Sphingomonas TaxID=196159 RepID=UPI0022B2BC21|nr:peptidoglycan endopeptidase [Sphingomonas sp. NIBR02145]WHU01338.1 peptidoglycan endopeptidase [Sphingomonas sp. NIBR02145]
MSAVLARARAMIGVRFRPRGRTREGLDCVGLAGWAYGAAIPAGYAMRSDDRARVSRVAASLGLVMTEARQPGDLVLLASGPGQLHLGIDSGTGLIHADAMLRRVVERPDPLPWPVIGRWRKSED